MPLALAHLHVLGVELVDHRRAHDHRQTPDRGQGETQRRKDQLWVHGPGPVSNQCSLTVKVISSTKPRKNCGIDRPDQAERGQDAIGRRRPACGWRARRAGCCSSTANSMPSADQLQRARAGSRTRRRAPSCAADIGALTEVEAEHVADEVARTARGCGLSRPSAWRSRWRAAPVSPRAAA